VLRVHLAGRAIAWGAAAAAAIALAACGGGESDQDRVRSTVEDYLEAFLGGDGARACELMTPDTRREFVNRVSNVTRTGDCARAVRTLRTLAGDTTASALKSTKVGAVSVSGRSATARLSTGAGGAASTTQLQEVGGKWLVSGVPRTP
jgi:hypothetical protein